MDSFSEQREKRNQLLSLFVEIRRVGLLCNPLYQQYADIEEEKRQARSKNPTLAVLGIVMGVGLLVAGIWPIAIGNLSSNFGFEWGVFFFCVLLLAGGCFLVYYCVKKIRSIQLAKEGVSNAIDKLNQRQLIILDHIDKIYNESSIAGIYPQKYLFPDAIEYCYTLINDMRADSIKEAINLYEDIMYKERIEKSQREATETLKSIDRETTKARKAAQFAAIASGVSAYYSRKTYKSI